MNLGRCHAEHVGYAAGVAGVSDVWLNVSYHVPTSGGVFCSMSAIRCDLVVLESRTLNAWYF